MELDRKLQLEILKYLKDAYPESAEVGDNFPGDDHPDLQANLFYLAEHGLITALAPDDLGPRRVYDAGITANGLDFIEDDGGIRAILNTVYVRLDPEDIKSLISNRIDGAAIPQADKQSLKHAIRSLPAEAMKTLVSKLISESVDHLPDALRLIQRYVEQSV